MGAVIQKNAVVDAVGFGHLSELDLQGLGGIEGDPNDARIYHDLELFGAIQATLILCDEHLGLYYSDASDNLHGYQISNVPRLVRELIAAEMAKWDERHPGIELDDHALDRLGFESVF